MPDNDLSVFFRGMRLIVEDARQRVHKDRCGFLETYTVIREVKTGLAVIPLKVQPQEFNFDATTSANLGLRTLIMRPSHHAV